MVRQVSHKELGEKWSYNFVPELASKMRKGHTPGSAALEIIKERAFDAQAPQDRAPSAAAASPDPKGGGGTVKSNVRRMPPNLGPRMVA